MQKQELAPARMNIKQPLIIISIAFCLLVPYASLFAQTSDRSHIPEWFFKVSPAGEVGVIGYAYKYSAKYGEDTTKIAKINAVDSLRHFIGQSEFMAKKQDIFSMIRGKTDSVSFTRGTLKSGVSFEDQGMIFHRMSFERNKDKAQEDSGLYAPVCNFEKCSPGWLCSQVQYNLAGFLGISYRASTPGRQLEISQKNALEILQYSLGVDVKGQEQYYKLSSSIMKINYRRKSYDVAMNQPTSEAYLYTKAQCFRGDTLFSWQVSEEIPPYQAAKNLEWLKNPRADGVNGAVGFAEKDYTGFFSRQLRRAYENGITELAKIYGASVTNNELHKNTNTAEGKKTVIDIHINYEQKLKPKVLGVFVNEQEQMYVWVASEVAN